MATLPDLNRTYSTKSSLRYNPRFLRTDFGDGYAQVTPAGLNHIRADYNIVYELLDTTDANTLRNFLYDNANGSLVTVKLYNIDPTGVKTAKFRIVNWQESNGTSPILYDFTISVEGPYEEELL